MEYLEGVLIGQISPGRGRLSQPTRTNEARGTLGALIRHPTICQRPDRHGRQPRPSLDHRSAGEACPGRRSVVIVGDQRSDQPL